MSEYLGDIIYLTQSQYDTLKNNGTVGPYTGLNNSNLYITDSALGSTSDANTIRASLGVKSLQLPVESATPDSATTTFVKSVTQNSNGEITVRTATLSTVPISQGGTGTTSINSYGIVYGNSDGSAYASTNSGNDGQVIISKGNLSSPTWYGGLNLRENGTNYSAEFQGAFTILGNTVIGDNSTYTNSTLTVAGATTISGATTINNTLEVNGITTINGNLIPTLSTNNPPAPNKTLGSSANHWSAAYIGTADTYGDTYTPIYWNNGVPTEVDVVKKYSFNFTSGETTAVITPTNTNKRKSIVTQIVVDTGMSYLNGSITWNIPINDEDANKDKIVLTTSTATSGVVSGYILVSIGS